MEAMNSAGSIPRPRGGKKGIVSSFGLRSSCFMGKGNRFRVGISARFSDTRH